MPFQASKKLKFRALKVISVFLNLGKKKNNQVLLVQFCGFMSGKKKSLFLFLSFGIIRQTKTVSLFTAQIFSISTQAENLLSRLFPCESYISAWSDCTEVSWSFIVDHHGIILCSITKYR